MQMSKLKTCRTKIMKRGIFILNKKWVFFMYMCCSYLIAKANFTQSYIISMLKFTKWLWSTHYISKFHFHFLIGSIQTKVDPLDGQQVLVQDFPLVLDPWPGAITVTVGSSRFTVAQLPTGTLFMIKEQYYSISLYMYFNMIIP